MGAWETSLSRSPRRVNFRFGLRPALQFTLVNQPGTDKSKNTDGLTFFPVQFWGSSQTRPLGSGHGDRTILNFYDSR